MEQCVCYRWSTVFLFLLMFYMPRVIQATEQHSDSCWTGILKKNNAPKALVNAVLNVLQALKEHQTLKKKCFYIRERENRGKAILSIVIHLRKPKHLFGGDENYENMRIYLRVDE